MSRLFVDMQYNVTKLDGRYNYGSDYHYMIVFSKLHWPGTGVLRFDRARRWFTDAYGWSQDILTQTNMVENCRHHPEQYDPNDINPVWAYCAQYNDYRIYVATDRELSWFILCHPKS